MFVFLWRDGKSHKRFSQYFENSKETGSEASDSDSSQSVLNDKENKSKPGESSVESSQSDTDEEDDDGLILPAFKTIPEDKLAAKLAISDSEPEDPEEVRKLQERLMLRRSRAHNTNLSTVSTKNQTLQHNRTNNISKLHSIFLNHTFSDIIHVLLAIYS